MYIGGEASLQALTGDIAFVDVEATGTSFCTDEILSAAVIAGGGEVLVDSLVKPDVASAGRTASVSITSRWTMLRMRRH